MHSRTGDQAINISTSSLFARTTALKARSFLRTSPREEAKHHRLRIARSAARRLLRAQAGKLQLQDLLHLERAQELLQSHHGSMAPTFADVAAKKPAKDAEVSNAMGKGVMVGDARVRIQLPDGWKCYSCGTANKFGCKTCTWCKRRPPEKVTCPIAFERKLQSKAA